MNHKNHPTILWLTVFILISLLLLAWAMVAFVGAFWLARRGCHPNVG